MNITQVFFGADDKLRSGWRFAIFVIGFIITAGFLSALVIALVPDLMQAGQDLTATALLVNSSVMLVPALFVGWLCGKYLERLPFKTLGASFKGLWLVNLLLGIAIGAVTLMIAVGLAMTFAGTRFVSNEHATNDILYSLTVSGAVFFLGAAAEEALFRGYVFQTFMRSNLTFFAVIFTSLLFATVHQGNPGANALGWANTFLAGIWFGVAYLKTRDLWFVTGLHFIWNWMQGSVFGIEVSGLTKIVTHPVLKEIETGPTWIGGGEYGLEGGIVTTVAIILSTIAIYFLPIKAEPELIALTSPKTIEGQSQI
jgi:membrane protease YdiL (CAAX protease family)